jgi:transmembrane sensor
LKNTLENIDELLGKYLAGEASEQERNLVEVWLSEDEQNRYYYNQLKIIFDKAASIPQTLEFDTDAAWMKVKSNLKKNTPVIPIQRKSYSMWYQAAAAVLILFVIGLYVFTRPGSVSKSADSVEVIAEKTSVKDVLPDGSDIFLNKKTKLVYAYDKKAKKHEVKLNGEAYFNIKNSKKEDFIVDAGGVFIRDIGTSFNVKAYPNLDEVEVLVEEGEIEFFTDKNPGIHLKAGGKGVYNKKTGSFTIEPPDANITAYKTKFFIFDDSSLGSMVEELNSVYSKQIVIADNLKNCEMTVSFKDEPIEEIAAVIAETLSLTTRVEQEKIILEGDGCD